MGEHSNLIDNIITKYRLNLSNYLKIFSVVIN